jgi:hypothetical protein
MTNDYKERVIKWLTGNYDIEQSSTEPLFQELEQTQTTISTYMGECLGYIQGRDGKGNELDIGFIYGNSNSYIENSNGVIIIVDSNFNILQVIDEYDSGTKFTRFTNLNIDITNGNIYGVDERQVEEQSNKYIQYRFILLNNFLVKTPTQENYEVKLRNSYFLNFTKMTDIEFVDKKPNEAFYLLIGRTNGDIWPVGVATYKIEVGSTNELIEYESSTSIALKSYETHWSGDNYTIKINGVSYGGDLDNYEINYREIDFNGETFTLIKDFEIAQFNNYAEVIKSYKESDFAIINGEVYLALLISHPGDSNISIYKIEGTNLVEYRRIEQTTITTFTEQFLGGRLFKKNNQLFYFIWINTDYSSTTSDINFTIEFGIISSLNGAPYVIKETFENKKIYDILKYSSTKTFAVVNTYNLYTYNLISPDDNELIKIQQIYNPLNYNFEDYQDLNSLEPNSAWLYNNNKIIFARNLYNKTINGNTTIATLEVPNLMLNDIDIEQQDLLGGTNGTLITNTDTIQKNIYEDLFINFYNTLTMQNQNTQDYVNNLVGSTRLNNSISTTLDYNNALINKIRINYTDDTSFIQGIQFATQVSQFVYNFEFQIYVDKPILNIELISNDENTVYQTIDLSVEVGKYYNINQRVEIGG